MVKTTIGGEVHHHVWFVVIFQIFFLTSGSMWVRAVVRMTPPPKQERQDTMKPPLEFSDRSTWTRVGLRRCSRVSRLPFLPTALG